MKIILTGSLGSISKPLAQELVQKGHQITVISSNPEKQKSIEALGAKAAIRSIEDRDFLTKTFTGADAVYCMLPPFKFMEDPNLDVRTETFKLATNYAEAIKESGVKKVIHLSSLGGNLEKGHGLLVFHHIMEKVLQKLPADIVVIHIRPVGFHYNVYQFMEMIQGKGFLESFIGKILTLRYYGIKGFLQGQRGIILSNYGGNDKVIWVSPVDIASAIATEIQSPMLDRKVTYVASEILTCSEVAKIIGTAIGKPYLKWETISDKQLLNGMKQAGLPESLAKDITEMNASIHNGLLYEDFYQKKTKLKGNVKMKDFAKDFAVIYHKQP